MAKDFATQNAWRVCGAVEGLERRLAHLARMQHSVVTRAQLLILGFDRNRIDRMVKSGRLRILHRGIYLVGPAESPISHLCAAVLLAGPDAAISHRSAAALHGFGFDLWERPVHVTVPNARHPRNRPGVRIHRAGPWCTSDVVRAERLPVTSPLRTILDLAGSVSRAELEQAVAIALRRHAFTKDRLLAVAEQRSDRIGMPVLRALLARPTGPAFTRSRAERMLLDLVRAARLPEPETNVLIGNVAGVRYEADVLWREYGLIVEFDSIEFHGDERSFHDDRARDAQLLAMGYRVMRVTWEQLVEEPHVVIARIAGALAAIQAA